MRDEAQVPRAPRNFWSQDNPQLLSVFSGESRGLLTICSIIIHQTHYEKSDWSRAFNQFTIACELDMINAISAADIAFIMSSSTSAWLPSPFFQWRGRQKRNRFRVDSSGAYIRVSLSHLPTGIFLLFLGLKQLKIPAGKCDGYTRMLQMNPPRITKTTHNSAAPASSFLVHSVAVTANYSVKLSNVTYYTRRQHSTTNFSFYFYTLMCSLKIQLQENSPWNNRHKF